jgi:hypothetical protein
VDSHAPAKSSRGPVLAAIATGFALVVCCILAPALIGAAWMLSLAPWIEAALLVVALALVVKAIRRHRANRGC